MAKFCKFCGSGIEEGSICNCKESLEEAARLVNQAESREKNIKRLNNNSKKVLQSFKEYFGDLRSTTKRVLNENDILFIASSAIVFIMSVILNFISFFNRLAKDINNIINTSGKSYNMDFFELKRYNFTTKNGSIILYGLLFSIILLAILLAIVFVTSKIKNKNLDSKAIVFVTIINTIPMTCCLIIGGILQFFISYKLIFIMQILYLIMYIVTLNLSVNALIGRFNKVHEIILFTLLVFIGVIITIYAYYFIIYKSLGSYEVYGRSISMYFERFVGEIESQMDIFKDGWKDGVYEMIQEFIEVIGY